jgi:hypothetical protein
LRRVVAGDLGRVAVATVRGVLINRPDFPMSGKFLALVKPAIGGEPNLKSGPLRRTKHLQSVLKMMAADAVQRMVDEDELGHRGASEENRGIVAKSKFFAKTDFTPSILGNRLLANGAMLARSRHG